MTTTCPHCTDGFVDTARLHPCVYCLEDGTMSDEPATVDVARLRDLLARVKPETWWYRRDESSGGEYVALITGVPVLLPENDDARNYAALELALRAAQALPALLDAYEERDRLASQLAEWMAAYDRDTRCPKCDHPPGPLGKPKGLEEDGYKCLWTCPCECHHDYKAEATRLRALVAEAAGVLTEASENHSRCCLRYGFRYDLPCDCHVGRAAALLSKLKEQ